jgi:hydroxymethylbilane synthase
VDLAVHSLKDLPTDLAVGLSLGAVCERQDPRDAWVSGTQGPRDIRAARPGARIGTSSERRRAQTLATRPDVQVASIRGNVETRLRKLDQGQYDAVIMAVAGLLRLGLAGRITSYLEPPEWLSAPGQGAVAVESRADDAAIDELLRSIDDDAARAETAAERALLARLQGGCQVPVGARAWARGEELILHALVAAPDGSQVVRAQGRGQCVRAGELGIRVAEEMLGRGGEAIVASFREAGSGGRA